MQFCGAHIAATDTVAELDDASQRSLMDVEVPKIKSKIAAHCSSIAAHVGEKCLPKPSPLPIEGEAQCDHSLGG